MHCAAAHAAAACGAGEERTFGASNSKFGSNGAAIARLGLLCPACRSFARSPRLFERQFGSGLSLGWISSAHEVRTN